VSTVLVWLLLAVAVVALGTLVWWSSGRSSLRTRGPGSTTTPDQRLEQDRHNLDVRLRPGNDGNPFNPGGR